MQTPQRPPHWLCFHADSQEARIADDWCLLEKGWVRRRIYTGLKRKTLGGWGAKMRFSFHPLQKQSRYCGVMSNPQYDHVLLYESVPHFSETLISPRLCLTPMLTVPHTETVSERYLIFPILSLLFPVRPAPCRDPGVRASSTLLNLGLYHSKLFRESVALRFCVYLDRGFCREPDYLYRVLEEKRVLKRSRSSHSFMFRVSVREGCASSCMCIFHGVDSS